MASSAALPLPGDTIAYDRHRPEHTPSTPSSKSTPCVFSNGSKPREAHSPTSVKEEFEAYLKCGRLEHGFLRVKCEVCRHKKLVAFSCKRRGFCPSCSARRMAETAAHLADHVLLEQPVRQWVVSFLYPLRFLFATRPAVFTKSLASSTGRSPPSSHATPECTPPITQIRRQQQHLVRVIGAKGRWHSTTSFVTYTCSLLSHHFLRRRLLKHTPGGNST